MRKGSRKDSGQLMRVLARIDEVGYVDNFWAIDNYILRLGAIIHSIRHGKNDIVPINLRGEWGKNFNPTVKGDAKNFYYIPA